MTSLPLRPTAVPEYDVRATLVQASDAGSPVAANAAPASSGLRVCVVIPTYRRADMLERCLRAVLCQTLPAHCYEVVVADDGPDRSVLAVLERLASPTGPALRYVPVTASQGPAGARNRGWEQARAPVVAFTDDDTVPAAQWLEAGLAALSGGAAAVAGGVSMPIGDPPTDYERNESGLTTAEFVTANCFVTRRALEEVGGFDERFRMAWREDSDLQFALLARGYRIAREPRALVVHPVRPAAPGVSLRQQRKVLFDALLYKKWPAQYRARIRPRPPWNYFLIVASLLLAAGAALTGAWRLAGMAMALWTLLTLHFCAGRLKGTSHAPAHVLEMLATSALIPPLSVYWRLRGAWQFRTRFL
ncbi:glycosyltransferase [Verticiella sediminum]|uniref:Glycosyltransferase n=1 Tax=Verticiella sediminum TaxID=1247510 RepID=A0A556AF46_9BURK|nr:glycosyltransferase family 2 protein [Verticiella sediminum]TSH91511.1 glycosyltransferase [Verticiella sediminum]